jgi:threonine aldolase
MGDVTMLHHRLQSAECPLIVATLRHRRGVSRSFFGGVSMPQPAAAIDLRSDTVTRPSPGMRAAMAAAPVGDDQYGEDPSVNRLQGRIAALLGKERALFVPSGTMANQIALKLLTRPGEEVLLGHDAHMMWHEAGAGAANSGVLFTAIGRGGLFTADDFRAALKPPGHIVMPATGLVAIENTHNLGGGLVWPQEEAAAVCAAARAAGIASYLDGARLFNAAAASGLSLAELAAPFDLASVALSKGLGCPVGSVLAGSTELIARAVRLRRMFGGAMRQSGILAAAGLYALDHHQEKLRKDHANARLIAERLAALPGIRLDLATVETNIVVFHLDAALPDAAAIVAAARQAGVLVSALGPRAIRAVTHRDVSGDACRRAAEKLAKIIAPGS